jgi:hypothetical protein
LKENWNRWMLIEDAEKLRNVIDKSGASNEALMSMA